MELKRANRLIFGLIVPVLTLGAFVAAIQDPQNEETLKPVRRAERPRFQRQEWQGTFFNNLFTEGLVGLPQEKRPAVAVNANRSPDAPAKVAGDAAAADESPLGLWKELIDAESLENEVKRLQIELESLITTPVKFQTDYQNARYVFIDLSMLFAIISQHEERVRWQDSALAAQALFTQTAANCRTTSPQAYQSAKLAQDQLRDLVRGGQLSVNDESTGELDWSQAVDRIPVMQRLEKTLERLKQNSGNKAAFTSAKEELFHDASLIAAIGKVLVQDDVEDGDDEEYAELSIKMARAALEVRQAISLDNFEIAAAAINRIEQSCNDCHADWR